MGVDWSEAIKLEQKAESDRDDRVLAFMQAQDQQIKTMSETLKNIKDAIGADTIIGPENTEAYKNQASLLSDTIKTAE